MFRRKTVIAQGLCEEKSVYDCLNKLIAAQNRVSEQQLRWAKAEENPLFLCLFGRLAELTWMGNELVRQFQDKQTELNRVFRDIDQEEKIVDESRKALLSCKTKCLKLQKQLEHSKKKNDTAKVQSIEIELTTQGSLREHLRESVETQSHKLELYKVDLLKKGLKSQAQTYLDISLNYQALFSAQLQLADMLQFETPRSNEIHEEPTERNVAEDMKLLLSQVTETLSIYPPVNGGVNVKKLSEGGQSPPFNRRSSAEEPITKSGRTGKSQHSISQPVLVGHKQNGPLDDLAQTRRSSPLLLPQCPEEDCMAITSGEYCEIDLSPGIPEENHPESVTDHNIIQSSPVRQSSTQAADNDWIITKQFNGEQPTSRGLLQHQDLYHSCDSVTNEGSHHGSSSSTEDLKVHRDAKVAPLMTTPSAADLSDECYANPVDAINEFLLGKEVEFSSLNESEANGSPKSHVSQVEGGNVANVSVVLAPSEQTSLQMQPSSKEIQLQLFHERLFKDNTKQSDRQNNSEGSSEVDAESIGNRTHDYSEIDDEPTYSNPFDALAESSYRPPFRVKTNKLRRNVSLSTSSIQIPQKQSPQLAQRHSNSPPPPPLPLKDEKVLGAVGGRPVRYCKVGGESESKGMMTSVARSVSSASASVTQQKVTQCIWDRREPVWKRKNSQRRGSDDTTFQQQGIVANTEEEKPEAPLSLAERVRQLRQRSQSDGLTVDEVRLQSRPPMPLPIMEQEPAHDGVKGELKLNGQSQHMQFAVNGGSSRGSPARQKKWLERTVSDSPQPVYYARRGVAHVVPLSAREIVKQHISHAAT